MWFDFADPGDRDSAPGVRLNNVYHLNADNTYDVPRGRKQDLVAVRTYGGRGEIRTFHRHYQVVENDFILLDGTEIHSYRTLGDSWKFWWFEFDSMLPFESPVSEKVLGVVHNFPQLEMERSWCQTVLDNFKKESRLARQKAKFTLGMLFCAWLEQFSGGVRLQNPYQDRILALVSDLRSLPLRTFDQVELAASLGLGSKRFTQVFRQVTGLTPKACYDSIRLEFARELLKTRPLGLADIAQTLHFSSAFHFSRFFKDKTGIAPKDFRKGVA